MQIKNHISLAIKGLGDKASNGRMCRKYEACLRSLEAFDGANDADLLRLVDPDFVAAFARNMFDANPLGLGNVTLIEQFSTLRSIARHAIKDGRLPTIDVFPAVMAKMKDYFKDANVESTYSVCGPDFNTELTRLLRVVVEGINDGSLKYGKKAVIVYLLGLMLGGLEIEDVLSLPKFDKEDRITINKYGIEVKLAESGKSLIAYFNGNRNSAGKLLAGEADHLGVKRNLQSFLREKGINVYVGGSILADFAAIALAHGESLSLIQRFITQTLDNDLAEGIKDWLKRQISIGIDSDGILDKRWYILVSYAARQRGCDMKAKIGEIKSADVDLRRECYDPFDEYKVKVGARLISRNNAAVSKYLFVKTRRDVAETIERSLSNALFLRTPGDKRRRATIPESEVLRLRAYLRDYRDDVLLVDDVERWAAAQNLEIETGDKVLVLNGPFAGCKGTVQRVKRVGSNGSSSEEQKIFVTSFYHGISLVTLNLRDIELQKIVG